MSSEPSRAATKRRGWKIPAVAASAVPTRTGAAPVGSVRGRAAMSQMRMALGRSAWTWTVMSRPPGELRVIRLALGLVGLAPLPGLLGAVEEEGGVVRELLDAGVAGRVGVEARLEEPQRERGEREHLAAPLHGLLLQALERHDGVDEAHRERLPGVVLPAQQPELLRTLGADEVAQHGGAEPAVPGADPRPRLAEAGVVGGDREVADEVQDVSAAERVAGPHRDDRLGQAADLD